MNTSNIMHYLSGMKDPRINRKKLHLIEDIAFIAIAAVLSGAESWNDIEDYGKTKKEWLNSFLSLPNGIPSHDTFNRVFSAIDPSVFEECFMQWVNSLLKKYPGEVVAIDGKTIRGSRKKDFHSATHVVSAWSNTNQLVIGQIQVDNKSNEITAIPKLLDSLLLEGNIVTIDAMGCQVEIAKKIRSKKADYILAVKENQSELLDDIRDSFKMIQPELTSEHLDFGHGRIETRKCRIINDLSLLGNPTRWKSLTSIIQIESERYSKTHQTTQKETRYYISSLLDTAENFLTHIRSHWGIENNLHWSLDVAFNEDSSRKRAGNAAMNFSMVNRIALNVLKSNQEPISMKRKRNRAGWDNEFLFELLNF